MDKAFINSILTESPLKVIDASHITLAREIWQLIPNKQSLSAKYHQALPRSMPTKPASNPLEILLIDDDTGHFITLNP